MLTKCPHCGYTLQDAANIRKKPQRAKRGHKRLPNGFGQITKLRDSRLRKPFRAMVTVGKNESGRPICKLLKPTAYFATYNEAYEALLNHSKYPQIRQESITFEELYRRWFSEISSDGRAESTIKGVKAAYSYCKPLYTKHLDEISSKDLRDCILEANTSANFKQEIKMILGTMYDYAVSLDYVDKNYAKAFKLPRSLAKEASESVQHHISFTDEEFDAIWKISSEDDYAAMVLIQCYSGWRPGELIDLEMDNIDLKNWSFTGGKKTVNGINRCVPIHSKIRPIVKKFYDTAKAKEQKYLFEFGYDWYYKNFKVLIRTLHLNPEHKPHDARKHFVTMAKRKGVDDYAIKRIVGHAITDLTERVYTERDLEWLRSEIEKI